MVKVDMPEFKTEKEEAEWWDAHPEVLLAAFEEAKSNGELRNGNLIREAIAASSRQPQPRLEVLVAQCDPAAPPPPRDPDWDDAPAVGNEML